MTKLVTRTKGDSSMVASCDETQDLGDAATDTDVDVLLPLQRQDTFALVRGPNQASNH